MTQPQQGKDVLNKVLRYILTLPITEGGPTATEQMRAALALTEMDSSLSDPERNRIREIINGFRN